MEYLRAIGLTVKGHLSNPPPKAVLTTVIWATSRSHPAVSALAVLALFLAWSVEDE